MRLPWSRSGTRLAWNDLSHAMILLPEYSEEEVLAYAASCPLGRHEWAVLLKAFDSPPVLTTLVDAVRNFDEILEGPGYIFGVDSLGLDESFVGYDLAEYDGGDRLTFLLNPPIDVRSDV
nr:hypothetical protein GCM10020241_51330 [Streptoalloteichus tenebrarius]